MAAAPESIPARGPSRRDVTRAMAWSVPAVAIAASVPAQAASGTLPMVLVGTPCKLAAATAMPSCPAEILDGIFNGDTSRGFAFPLQITNTTGADIVIRPGIQITNVRDGLGDPSTRQPFDVLGTYPDYCSVIEPEATLVVYVYADSGNDPFQETYFDVTVPWGHDCVDPHPPIFFPDLYVRNFAPCSTNSPFPQGSPACTPKFYQS